VKKWHKIIDDYRVKHEESRLRMHEAIFDGNDINEQLGMFARDAINLNSPKQITDAFRTIGIEVDNGTAEREIALMNHPAAKELLEYRKLQKIMSSYGSSFLDKIHPFTGRIHADYQQIGTETGRFACKDPNLQQMPDEFRQCVTSPDYTIVVADYSQIELRILAEYSEDPKFMEAFNSGEDLHKATAATMFNISTDAVTKEQRFIAKTINFGISYGMGPNKLMDMLNAKAKEEGRPPLSFQKVAGIMSRYKDTYKGVNKWLMNAGNLAYRQSYSETMAGRKRWFTRPASTDPEWEGKAASIKRQGANSPIQGTNADITKMAMLNLYHDIKTYGFKADIILQVHDEIAVLAHKGQAEDVKNLVESSMIESAQTLLKKVPVKVDCYINDVWKK
jgi:DNA polymerase-1